MSGSAKRFRVAFSFAGEKRGYVAQVAAILGARFGEAAILYDKYHEAEFGRRDLGFYLPDLYHKETDLVVVVVSPDYERKPWCGLEWDATFDLLKNGKNSAVMLCRFDHAMVKGLYSTAGFVELDDKTPELAATRIFERLALNEGKAKEHYVSNSSTVITAHSVGDFRAAPSRLSSGSDLLIGRDDELKAIDAAWSGAEKRNVVTFVAWGGVGKTSLVARWAANTLAKENHGGVERYFDWSFYSQGTRIERDTTGADKAASADVFIKDALEWFGDPELAASNATAWQKGERLAHFVAEHRTILILDGLEPLQDAKGGGLRDEGLRALLRGLAANNRGLCLVTTRQQVPELNTWHTTSAPEQKLEKLSKEAGAELLTKVGIKGTPAEREKLAEDVKGHALTLTLLGKYLAEAHGGDIRKRDLVSLSAADYEETSGHAFHVMEAYERWLERDGRRVELAILRLLGLFDRPATPDCLVALRTAFILDLTDTFATLTDSQWNLAVTRIVQLGLAEEQQWDPRRVVGYGKEDADGTKLGIALGNPSAFDIQLSVFNAIDAHPLVREYFGRRLRETSAEAWRAANSLLFDHLRNSVPYWPEGLDGLQPLYQAVAHGCQAGRYQEACDEVFDARIMRGATGAHARYSEKNLGAMGANLGAVACFFVVLWTQPAAELPETTQVWLMHEAARFLWALGRLAEARQPMQFSVEHCIEHENWAEASISTSNLSQLDLRLGDLVSAVNHAKQSVAFADRTEDPFLRMGMRAVYADTLHQAGSMDEARARFEEAEGMQREMQTDQPMLYSSRGFWFCDLLLADGECAAWRVLLERVSIEIFPSQVLVKSVGKALHFRALHAVVQRATQTLEWAHVNNLSLLAKAGDHLTLGRAALYRAILEPSLDMRSSELLSHLDEAVHGLYGSSDLDVLPGALLTRAWLLALQGRTAEARADLDEAQQIAERGPMPLHLADVHLHRARLFFRDDLDAAREELKQARALVEKHGYLRRMPELEDAEKVILAAK